MRVVIAAGKKSISCCFLDSSQGVLGTGEVVEENNILFFKKL